MSYHPRQQAQPSYARQTSFEDPSTSASTSTHHYGGGAPSTTSNVNRRPTVRGAVRGTVREVGTNPRLSMLPGAQGVGRGLTRGKTLTRPDRFVAPAPLINPGLHGGKSGGGTVQTTLVNGQPTLITSEPWYDPWTLFVEVSTFWAPKWLLRRCGMVDEVKMRAWKEKCALCTISAVLMALIGFITIGLNRTLCPSDATSRFRRMGTNSGGSLSPYRARRQLTEVENRLRRHQRLGIRRLGASSLDHPHPRDHPWRIRHHRPLRPHLRSLLGLHGAHRRLRHDEPLHGHQPPHRQRYLRSRRTFPRPLSYPQYRQ